MSDSTTLSIRIIQHLQRYGATLPPEHPDRSQIANRIHALLDGSPPTEEELQRYASFPTAGRTPIEQRAQAVARIADYLWGILLHDLEAGTPLEKTIALVADYQHALTEEDLETVESTGSLTTDEILQIIQDARQAVGDLATPWSRREIMLAEYHLTDLGNAERFLRRYAADVRYCPAFKIWFVWNGQIWQSDQILKVQVMANEVVRSIYTEASTMLSDQDRIARSKHAAKSESHDRKTAMILSAAPMVAVHPNAWDARSDLFCCQNGTYDLSRHTFRAHRRSDLLTRQAGVEFDPHAECPTWVSHLDLVFQDNQSFIADFQKMCGYTLLAENPEQIMFIPWGTGQNGKSVTLNVLSYIWGGYAMHLSAESLMVRKSEGPRTDLARLPGARLITSSEGDAGARLSEAWVKQLTGGDQITVRRLYQEEFQFRPTGKIWFSTNHLPTVRGSDHAIWRRLWPIPFTVTIPLERRDYTITDRLQAEGPGILNWCLEGLRAYQDRGYLEKPQLVKDAAETYRADMDRIGPYLEERCFLGPADRVSRKELFADYKAWCDWVGEQPLSARSFADRLHEHGVGDGGAEGHAYTRFWKGIRLKSQKELSVFKEGKLNV